MTKKRDSEYYKKRLAKDRPDLLVEVRAGRLSVRAASVKAGLIRPPGRLVALKREWRRATTGERLEFVKWAKAGSAEPARKPIADRTGRLRPEVKAFLARWLKDHNSRPGRILKEIGFSGFDYRLATAVSRGDELHPEIIPKLSVWLKRQGFS